MPAPKPVCYKCGGQIAPAALNPKAMWCALCAEELSLSGGPLVKATVAAPSNEELQRREIEQPAVHSDQERSALAASGPEKESRHVKVFNVRIGNVSFTSHDRVELDIAGTRVVIT